MSDVIGPGETHRWLVGASAGQTMIVLIASDAGDVWFTVADPTGQPMATTEQLIEVELVDDGDHAIDVWNFGDIEATYVLIVAIP